MPKGTRVNEFSAPVGGMEWRKGYQKDHHAQVLLNVDLSKGTLRARKGFVRVAGAPVRTRLHLTDRTFGERYIVGIGPLSLADESVHFAAFTEWGDAVGATVDLTALFGEPPQRWPRCSFINTILADSDSNGHNVTIISTPFNTYVYEPYKSPGTVRLLNPDKRPTGDAIRQNDDSMGYVLNRPRGYIATEHQSRIFYAGFGDEYQAWLSSPVEDDQNAVDEMILGADRSYLTLGQQHSLHTDRFDPAGINAFSVMSVEDNEPIRGLRSFQDNLISFTDRSIYVLTGNGLLSFSWIKADSGHGCAAHNSIIEVGGVLYYMGYDGVYAFGGLAAPQAIKISTPIDALWHGEHDDKWVFEDFHSTLSGDYGWPWRIDHSTLQHCNVVHVSHLNQIWWSVPLKTGPPGVLGMTLVFDYVRAAWTVYMCLAQSATNGELVTPMFDAVSVSGEGEPRIFASNNSVLTRYGHHRDRSNLIGIGKGITTAWVSVPLNDDGAHEERQKDARLHILSSGKKPAANPVRVAIAGDEAHFDMQQTTRQEKAGNLDMHPDESLSKFFFGEAEWDDALSKWSARDWFLSKFSARVRSQSWRIGVMDNSIDEDRGVVFEMKNFSTEAKTLGSK